MPIVTLTTDYGTRDHFVAVLKGRMLSRRPDLTIVDVSHEIEQFDAVQAAFVLKHAYPSFPGGTIHVAIVNNRPEVRDLLCLEHDGHYFLIPDNGMATLLFGEVKECFVIPPNEKGSWKERIAVGVEKLVNGEDPATFAERKRDFVQRIHLTPVVTSNFIRGTAIHIDHYDNVVFNITREIFEQTCAGRPFELYYKRHDPVTKIQSKYYDVPIGEVLCRFNDLGFLELAINMGKAASLLGIKVDDMVQIHFIDFD